MMLEQGDDGEAHDAGSTKAGGLKASELLAEAAAFFEEKSHCTQCQLDAAFNIVAGVIAGYPTAKGREFLIQKVIEKLPQAVAFHASNDGVGSAQGSA